MHSVNYSLINNWLVVLSSAYKENMELIFDSFKS